MSEHVAAFLAVRPSYGRAKVEDIEDTSVSLGIPWCPSCADWHEDDEPHSPLHDDGEVQVLDSSAVWLPIVEAECADLVDQAVPDPPPWVQESIDLVGRVPVGVQYCGEWVRVDDTWTTCRNPRPCSIDHDAQLRLTEDGYMTPGGCARLALVLALAYLLAWVVIDAIVHR